MKNEKIDLPDNDKKVKESPERKVETASDNLEEDSISTEAIDFEDSSFIAKNKNRKKDDTKKEEHKDENEDEDDVDDYEKSFLGKDEKPEDDVPIEKKMDDIIHEIADQPFEVAMDNLEVKKEDLIHAAAGIFSQKGYFEEEYDLPFGDSVTLRSKTVNDYIDYTEYVRRLLLEPISQNEYDTFTQIRNLTYAVVVIDGDDISQLPTEEKFNILYNMNEAKISAIINSTKQFWRISHLLLHPGLVDFLVSIPEE